MLVIRRLSIFLAFPLLAFVMPPSAGTSFKIGVPYDITKKTTDSHFFYNGENIIVVKTAGKKFLLQKFDEKTLKLTKETEYEDLPQYYVVEDILKVNERLYLFYSLYEKPNEQLFCREIDMESGTFKEGPKLLISVGKKIAGTLAAGKGNYFEQFNFQVVDKFNTQFNFDGTKFLIQYRVKPTERNDDKNSDIIGINVFDSELNKLWGNEFKMPYTEKKMNNMDYSVDSDGNAYLLAKVYNDNTTKDVKKINDPVNFHLELFRIKAKTNKINISPLRLGTKLVTEMALFETPGNLMICAGFYYKNDRKPGSSAVYKSANSFETGHFYMDGVFVFTADENGKIENARGFEVPISVINQYVSNREKKSNLKDEQRGQAELQEMHLRELSLQEDGGVLITGEEQYQITTTTISNGKTRTTTTYYYNDILATKIDSAGNLAWMKKLPKRQRGKQGKGGMGYKYIYNKGAQEHQFVFIDNVKNMAIDESKEPAQHYDGAGGFLTTYKISNSDGKISKVSILDMKDAKGLRLYNWSTEKVLPLPGGKYIFEAYKKKKENVLVEVSVSPETGKSKKKSSTSKTKPEKPAKSEKPEKIAKSKKGKKDEDAGEEISDSGKD